VAERIISDVTAVTAEDGSNK